MIKSELGKVSIRGNTMVLSAELAEAIRAVRNVFAESFGEEEADALIYAIGQTAYQNNVEEMEG